MAAQGCAIRAGALRLAQLTKVVACDRNFQVERGIIKGVRNALNRAQTQNFWKIHYSSSGRRYTEYNLRTTHAVRKIM